MKKRIAENRMRILWIVLTGSLILAGILLFRLRKHKSALCFEVASLLILYGVVVAVLDMTGYLKRIRNSRYTAAQIVLFVAITAFLEIVVFRKVANDRFVYYWDYSGWWIRVVSQSRACYSNYLNAMSEAYRSVLVEDYNSFVAMFTALPVQVMGETYPIFVMIIHNMFAIPAILVIACAGERLCTKAGISVPWLLCYFVVSMCPVTLRPVANGYADAFALLLAALLMLLAVEFDWKHPCVSHVVTIGLLIPLCLAARRYFAFFLIGYILLLALCAFVTVLHCAPDERRSVLLRSIGAYALIGIVSLAVFATVLWKLLIRSINNDFAIAYSAYSFGNLADKFLAIDKALGGILVIFVLVGVLIALSKRESRGAAAGMVAGCVVACLAFFRIQSMGEQHYYIVLVFLLPLVCVFFGTICGKLRRAGVRYVALSASCVLLMVNMLFFMGVTDTLSTGTSRPRLFTTMRNKSLQRDDLGVIQSMMADLRELDGSKYVLASSKTFNDETLVNANYPYEELAVEGLCNSADVDLRDGFPRNFIDAQIVLVATPVQIHLSRESQRVIVALAEHFIDGTLYAKHYEELGSYRLDGGVVVRVLRKTEPWTQEDYDQLKLEFNGYYPDYPELFTDRIHP